MTSAQSVAVAIAVLSAEQFEDSFGDFMLEGLDSGPTYVPFVVDADSSINIAFRPKASQYGNTYFIGGTFRVGYILDSDGDSIVEPLSFGGAIAGLEQTFPGFGWNPYKQNAKRFSTVIGIRVAGGAGDGDTIHELLTNVATSIVLKLGDDYSAAVSKGFDDPARSVEAIVAVWEQQLESYFGKSDIPEMDSSVVGAKTPVLNLTDVTDQEIQQVFINGINDAVELSTPDTDDE